MRTPPLLLAATLLFWGWQSGLWLAAVPLAVVLESPRFFKARWDLSDADITRIWNFSFLLLLGATIFAFTSNEGFSNYDKFFAKPDMENSRLAGNSTTLAAVALIRWLPLIFCLFATAQAVSSRAEFPLETISPFLRYRHRKLLKSLRPAPRVYYFNVTWPYFVLCLYAAGAHASEDHSFFWGVCGLVGWALWSQRPRGFGRTLWLLLLVAVIAGGFFGQHGLSQIDRLVNYNPQWLASFMRQRSDPEKARTAMGQIGKMQLSRQIVIRVQPVVGEAVPTYLRDATYRTYHASRLPFWTVGGSSNSFTTVPEIPADSGNWVIDPGRFNHSQVNIACYLNDPTADGWRVGLLPLPVDCDRLEKLADVTLKINSVGAVLCEGPGLVEFNAGFGTGGAAEAPPGGGRWGGTNNPSGVSEDLAVPVAEQPALDQVIATLPLAGLDHAKTLLAVSRYFESNYQYCLWQDAPMGADTNDTALANFLLHTHRGHCEFFASATVLLLRELGIPARYAVGYYVHEHSGHGYVVRQCDAHAWGLAWDDAHRTWQVFDTTPSSWTAGEGRSGSLRQAIADFFAWCGFEYAKFRWGQGHLRPYLLVILLPLLSYFLHQIIRHRRRHKPSADGRSAAQGNWPGLDSEFYLLERKLAANGLIRSPGQSQTDWLNQAVGDPALAGLREPLRQLLRLHYRHRFDPRGLPPADRAALRRQARDCLAALH